MQAYSRMYQYTGNVAILPRMNLLTKTWIESQKQDRMGRHG